MKFFEHQAQAKAKTFRLLSLYALGVLLLGLLSAGSVHFALNLDGEPYENLGQAHWSLVLTAAIGTWGVILLGSAIRSLRLGQGGRIVAESLGGTLLGPQSSDLIERRALNVVEEMALASGMPVPPVYILRRESGINAFAAGWSPDDAVIGLTQGALTSLSRSELQGVVAHEFSHILNRDSALNMRMLGVLHGIVALSLVGRFLTQSRGSSSRGKREVAPFFLIGAAFWILGSVGAFIAELIQAAVSREREFLADASAVQFTRDTTGLAGALAKIGAASSYLSSSAGRSANHLLIAEASAPGLFDLASHPPLKTRIQRLVPAWDGDYGSLARLSPGEAGSGARSFAGSGALGLAGAVDAPAAPGTAPSDWEEAEASESLFSETPRHMLEGAREPYFARLLILAATLDENLDARNTQLANIALSDPSAAPLLPGIHQSYLKVPPRERLPLIDLALGTLAALSEKQAATLASLLDQARAGLSPYAHRPHAILRLARRHLRTPAETRRSKERAARPSAVQASACLLGVLARRGQKDEADAAGAFALGAARLAARGQTLVFPSPRELRLDCVDAALDVLLPAPLASRRAVLDALEAVASFDGVVKPLENELIHTFAVCLNVATVARPVTSNAGDA